MINFLRRIRRDLMSENKTSVYLIYAVGEVVLVVFGILIALQIDNWNENNRIRNTEQQYLSALKEEFNFNKGELDRIMDRNQLNFENAVNVLENTGPGDPAITDEELGRLKSVAFEGHMTGVATMSFNLNNNYYPKLIEEMDKILQLIDDEIE